MTQRKLRAAVVTLMAASATLAAETAFFGTWKLNPAKSKMFDQMKVEKVGANKYSFDFVGDGSGETIVVDGTDQHGGGGTTLSVAEQGPDNWYVVRKKDGRVLLTANWKLSKDKNTLTDEFTNKMAPSGTEATVSYTYKRDGAGSGFAGTWASENMEVTAERTLHFGPYGKEGLTIVDPAAGLTRNLKFDGKDHENVNQNLTEVAMSALRRLDKNTLELTDKRSNGKVLDTQEIKVSPDRKTLTIAQRITGRSKTNIFVYERQK